MRDCMFQINIVLYNFSCLSIEFLRSRVCIDDFERIGHLEQHIEEICAHYGKEKE